MHSSHHFYRFGPYVLQPSEWRLEHGDQAVLLPPKSLHVLIVLVRSAGRLVTKEEILAEVWGNAFVEEGNVAFHIAKLRRILVEPAGEIYIETVKKRGYRFAAPVTVQTADAGMASPPANAVPAVVRTPAARAATPSDAAPAGRRRFLAAAVLGVLAVVGSGASLALKGAPFGVPARSVPDREASDLYLRAREHWKWRTPHSVQQAMVLYQRALEIDPAFARAHAGLADCYNLSMSGLSPRERYPRAKLHAERALILDPMSAEARTSVAVLRYKFEWRWQEAEDEFQHAIRLDPEYVLAHHWYGEFAGLMGRTGEALEHLKRALALDPQSLAIRGDMVPPLLRAGRVQAARRVVDDAMAIDPNWYGLPMRMADVEAAEGGERQSAENTWRAMVLRGVPLAEIDELRDAFTRGGRDAMTRALIRQYLSQDVEPTSPASFGLATQLSQAYGQIGERVEALRWLRIAIERREDAALHMLTHAGYDSIRADPRFQALLAEVGLAKVETPGR
jgi:DNA-binding winged helix-turn-helix (wHTH) protein/tetratricopeptide (TPR) repeat protein